MMDDELLEHLNTNQPVNKVDLTPWAELVYSLAGAWKEDFPTLEEIRDESEQDIQRESL